MRPLYVAKSFIHQVHEDGVVHAVPFFIGSGKGFKAPYMTQCFALARDFTKLDKPALTTCLQCIVMDGEVPGGHDIWTEPI